MTRALLTMCLAAVILIAAPAANAGRACTGHTPCAACKNCHGCKWCAKDGGTSGVCKKNANFEADRFCSESQ
jgi:hypothetical protein